MSLAWSFGALGTLANIAWIWPQAVGLRRRGNLGAVSAATWLLALLVAAAVVRVGLMESAIAGLVLPGVALVVTGVSQLIAIAVLLAAGVRAGWPRARTWIIAGLALVLGLALIAPGIWLGAAVLFIPIPQLVRVLLKRSAAGVSMVTWLIGAAAGLLWAVNESLAPFGGAWHNLAEAIVNMLLVGALLWTRRRTRTAAQIAVPSVP